MAERMHAKCSTTAGSFAAAREKPRMVTSFIHHGGKAACGGGDALSPQHMRQTMEHVSAFVRGLGWNEKAASAVSGQLARMALDADPEKHARLLHEYYRRLGIRHRAITENLETGERKTVVQDGPDSEWRQDHMQAAYADARHVVGENGREQPKQTPKGFYLGEGHVGKDTHNETFTIAGADPEYVRELLGKAERNEPLNDWEKHNLAAVLLSAYYYHAHGWPEHERLIGLLQNRQG